MKLRRAGPGDAAKLALVGAATFLESFAGDHDGDAVTAFVASDHSIAAYDAVLGDPGSALWLVEEAAGAPVGYAAMVQPALPGADPSRDLELKRIYVLSKWHGAGLGKSLYDAVEAEARARGAARLVLSVYALNAPAQRFYTSRGFAEIGRWLFKGFDNEDLIMAKDLVGAWSQQFE